MGTAIADLTVCGAVPPYNEVLGGKLVALLMASPEVTAGYRRRYGKTPSVIASSMAGRSVRRPADLVFLGTTSLYGRRPCQYDRIRFDWEGSRLAPRGDVRSRSERTTLASIRYVYLGRTAGIGTFQFGKRTVEALKTVLAHSKRGQQVNCVFGEGVNPRLRQIRDGLSELGLDADELLRHGSPRLVYGVSLVHNLFEYLVALEKTPRYILPQTRQVGNLAHEVTERMIAWWWTRWALGRIERDDVRERIARHNFVHLIRHGARVVLPRDPEQPELFDE